jgi:hypothetical protein
MLFSFVTLFRAGVIPVGAGITFQSSNTLGAVLLLRHSAARVDVVDCHLVRDYIAQHIDSWYEHARKTYQLPEGALVLVKGCDKTSSWAHATFAESSREAAILFNGGAVKDVAGAVVSLRGSWSRSTSAIYRELPISEHTEHPLITSGPPLFSHFRPECIYTVFVRVYKCKRRMGFGPIKRAVKISATEGYSSTLHLPDAVSPSQHSVMGVRRLSYVS